MGRGNAASVSAPTVTDPINITYWGAVADNSAYDSGPAIQAAIDALGADGGYVYIPPGVFYSGQTITFPTAGRVRIVGSGMRSSTIRRLSSAGDFILVDMSGASRSSVSPECGLEQINLHGDSDGPTPILRIYYSSKVYCNRLKIESGSGPAVEMVQVWDSHFTECRFDSCGDDDGTYPAVVIACRSSDSSDVFGYSTDSSNHIYFNNCVFEGNKHGIVIRRNYGAASAGTQSPHNIQIDSAHLESNKIRGSYIKVYGALECSVRNSRFLLNAFDSGYSTPINVLDVGNTGTTNTLSVMNCHFDAGTTVEQNVSSYIKCDGTTSVNLDYVTFNYGTGQAPTTAAVTFANSNTLFNQRAVFYRSNPAAAALFSGTPTSQLSLTPLLLKAGAVADSDFPGIPLSGAMGLDTSNSRLYVRVGSTWKYSALT